jgi:trans-aconitate 2-methyltransferase
VTEWKASEYTRISDLQRSMAEEVLALLEIKGDERILDIGCGNGKTTGEIAARVPRGSVVGVDFSSNMVDFANSQYAASHTNLEFQVADARQLPFTSEFNLVVSLNALHWVPEQELALKSIHAALKPEGRAHLRLVPKGEHHGERLEDVLEDTRLSSRWERYFEAFHDPYLQLTAQQYAELAAKSGFEVRSVHTVAKAWDFESREAFFAFGAVTFVEWLQYLSEAERPVFIHEVLDRYRQVASTAPGEDNFFRFNQMDILLLRI